MLELTFEKIRAGCTAVPLEKILDRITEHVRGHGLEVAWKYDEDRLPVATIRYTPDFGRGVVRLEQVQIREGQIRLAGKSNRSKGVVRTSLPTRKVLQSKFPRQKVQTPGVSIAPPGPTLRSKPRPNEAL